MAYIKNIELLPGFFNDIRDQFGAERLNDMRFVLAVMSDMLPGATELKRCVRLAYESCAIAEIIELDRDMDNIQLHKNKAIEKLQACSFMDKQIAVEIIETLMEAIFPQLVKDDICKEELPDVSKIVAETENLKMAVDWEQLIQKLKEDIETTESAIEVYKIMQIDSLKLQQEYEALKDELDKVEKIKERVELLAILAADVSERRKKEQAYALIGVDVPEISSELRDGLKRWLALAEELNVMVSSLESGLKT